MIEVPLGQLEIRGAIRVERTHRGVIPRRLFERSFAQIPDDFMRASVGQSAGIRLAFRTAATAIELEVAAMKMVENERVPLPAAHYELTSGGEVVADATSDRGSRFVFSFERPQAYLVDGPTDVVRFDGLPPVERDYELWLPYSDEVELLGFRANAPVTASLAPRGPAWLHHGSSISHGYAASRTSNTWPVVAALATGAELTSVAFSGNAVLDQLTARTIRDAPAELISLKLGINVVNGDLMRLRVFRTAVEGFLDTIRDGHPDTPMLVVSPIFCEPVEHAAGPTIQDPSREEFWVTTAGTPEDVLAGKLSLSVVRAELQRIVERRAAEDPAIRYLDGLRLYGPEDARAMPMPDNLHPADDVQRLIGERFARIAFGPGGFFAR